MYGRSKLEGERRVLEAHPGALVIRTNVVVGPDPRRKNFLYTLARVIGTRQPMNVATDQYSTPTYNEDLARAAVLLSDGGHTGLFHVSGPQCVSRWEFAQEAAEILAYDAGLLHPCTTAELRQKAPRPLRAGLRCDKLLAALPHLALRNVTETIQSWEREEAK